MINDNREKAMRLYYCKQILCVTHIHTHTHTHIHTHIEDCITINRTKTVAVFTLCRDNYYKIPYIHACLWTNIYGLCTETNVVWLKSNAFNSREQYFRPTELLMPTS